MKIGTCAALATSALAAAVPADAATRIDFFPNIGPASVIEAGAYVFSPSASFAPYAQNAIGAMLDNESSRGGSIADTPTAFETLPGHKIRYTDLLGTEFPSWRLDFNPAGAFAGEKGTWWRVGTRIESDVTFTLADVSVFQSNPFETNTTSLAELFTTNYPDGGFSPVLGVGIWYGPDGVRGGGDDVTCDSAACDVFTQPLNLFAWRGYGKLDYITNAGLDDFFGGDKAALREDQRLFYAGAYGFFTPPFTFDFTYTVNGRGGILAENSFRGIVTGVPEPHSWAMLIVGFGLSGAVLRRRRALAVGA